jgi:localization factor PodJL
MKLGVSWGLKGIRPDARKTAKAAARQAGMSLDDWLNSAIAHTAAQMGLPPAGPHAAAYPNHENDALVSVHHRLDELSQRINKVTRSGPEAYAPPHLRTAPSRQAAPLPHLPHAPTLAPAMKPPSPPVNWPPELDLAVAEISARQRALGGKPARYAPTPQQTAKHAAARPPVPTQDLSGLEEQLRHITAQIETLRQPGVEQAINALRDELAEIARTITEAMPRQAIEAIEAHIRDLGTRIAEGRQAGVNTDALAGLEHGLVDIRETLHRLTPAESLVGFHEAIDNLARKIDIIVAEKDPATLQQLESSIVTLRDISTHIASNEMVGRLASDVETLAEKIDRIANAATAGDALANLEHRISALSDALAERSENGGHVPPRLEALVGSLSEKIERIQQSYGENIVSDHLQDRIVALVERLDASDSRLGHLETIERGLAELLIHIDEMRAQKQDGSLAGSASPDVDDLKHDISRTKVSLDAVHGTLGHVVDRLTAIEQEIRREASSHSTAAFAEPAPVNVAMGKVAVRAVPVTAPAPAPAQRAVPQPQPQPQPAQAAQPRPAARPPMQQRQRPINPDLPPDEPLEPGTMELASPAERIAASEADLGDAKPAADPPPGGKSYFLAAARRAAKLALRDSTPRVSANDDTLELEDHGAPLARGSLSGRIKKLFIAASVIAIVIGLVEIASNYFDLGRSDRPKPAANISDSSKAGPKAFGDSPTSPETAAPSKIQDRSQPGSIMPPPTADKTGKSSMAPFVPNIPVTALSSVPELAGRSFKPAASDVTGSIAKSEKKSAANEKLPIVIGSAALRNAALSGEPTAAYEIAVRYAEGRGVPMNLEEALRWFERAASRRLAPAQFRLASLLEKGHGTKKDLSRARKLYLEAAEQGNAKAMHNLAVLYAEGIDGRPDYDSAVKWFRKASDHGVSDSQYNLGVLYARGLGVERNYGQSYKWFALAAAQGDREAARKRDEIAAKIDPKALALLQKTMKAWVPQRQPEAAVTVPAPPNGWDQASPVAAPVKSRSKASGAFEIGKR